MSALNRSFRLFETLFSVTKRWICVHANLTLLLVGWRSCCERCRGVQHRWPLHHQVLGNQICNGCSMYCSPRWPGFYADELFSVTPN